MDRFVKTFPLIALMGGLPLFSVPSRAVAQDQDQSQDQTQAQSPDQSQDKAEKRREQKHEKKLKQKSDSELKKELEPQYKNWLDQDVVYIITPEERHTFLHLSTNEEREQFIEAFWQRRNPDPDSAENTYKEEHYRRIAYANEHYASGIPGWKTDRGKIYIMWGPADEVDSHPTGGTWDRPMDQGGGETTTYAYEDWRYRYLEGIGENVELEFRGSDGNRRIPPDHRPQRKRRSVDGSRRRSHDGRIHGHGGQIAALLEYRRHAHGRERDGRS